MDLILSGYGTTPTNTLSLHHLEQSSLSMQWQTHIEDASYVCEGEGYLFTVTEAEDYAIVYLLQRSGQGFELLDQKRIEGGYLCHITYSAVNKAIFGACYGTGTVFSVRVKDGKFGELLFQEVQMLGDSKALTRAHCVLLNNDESELAVINIALDQIFFYQLDCGRMEFIRMLTMPLGSGPRHAIYSKDEQLIYVITEYSNEILIYEYKGNAKLIQRISTLAAGFTGTSNCSTLCFSKDGKYLYAANRGADTVAVFIVKSEGTLEWLGEYDCGGKHPRHMIITRNGEYLIVCNQFSDNVALFKLDQTTGALMDMIISTYYQAPSGILEWN